MDHPINENKTTQSSGIENFSNEDAYILWFFFSTQFSDIRQIAKTIHGKTLSEIYQRYLDIIETPNFASMVRKDLFEDFFGWKTFPFSKIELLYLYKIVSIKSGIDPADILQKFPQIFHPSRAPSALLSKMKSLDQQKNKLDMYIDSIKDYTQDYTKPLEHSHLNEKEQLLNELNDTSNQKKLITSMNEIFNEISENIKENTLALLIGQSKNYRIEKLSTTLGRISPKTQVDINLADDNSIFQSKISRNHCIITLATDYKFYIKVLGNYIILNGIILEKGQTARLNNYDVLDIGSKLLVFYENPKIFSISRD